MRWQPTRLTRSQLEERRIAAGRLLRAQTRSQAEVARRMSVSRASVTRWKHRLEQGGLQGLQQRRASGRPSRLTTAQWDALFHQLQQGAIAAGFDTERWTLRRIAHVIARRFGVHYHYRALSPALHARGWSPQRPLPQAKEREEALIVAWLQHDWPRIKRGLAARAVPSSSSTRRGTASGPGWAPPGHPSVNRPSSGA